MFLIIFLIKAETGKVSLVHYLECLRRTYWNLRRIIWTIEIGSQAFFRILIRIIHELSVMFKHVHDMQIIIITH